MNLIRLLELAGVAKAPTIVSATKADGEIDRHEADRMIDPHGYFKNKHPVQEDGWEDRNASENTAHEAEDYALENFDPAEFIDSDVFQDMANDNLTRDEIVRGLEYFLRNYIHHHFDSDFNGDLLEPAKIVYERVRDMLKQYGYNVSE